MRKNQTKENLTTHNATISRMDKGNSIVILYQNDHNTKFTGFLGSNNFAIENKDPTSKFQKDISDSINSCQSVVQRMTDGNI
jgi:hypothetical protein